MDDLDLVVARVRIAGDVELTSEAPDIVTGAPGVRLFVKFPYRYEEVSKKADSFRIQLTSSLDRQEATPATFTQADRRGLADDLRGYVKQEYRLAGPGDHVLEFRAAAEYTDDGHATKRDVTGRVKVHVADGAPRPL